MGKILSEPVYTAIVSSLLEDGACDKSGWDDYSEYCGGASAL